MKFDTAKLAEMGYGDITIDGETVELTDSDIESLADSCGGVVSEIMQALVEN